MNSYNAHIKELLDQIDKKYPLSRLAAAKRKWSDLWNFETPFSTPPIVLHRGRSIDGVVHPGHHTDADRRQILEVKLCDIIRMADIDDDYLPVLHLDTGAYILAEMFGGKHIYESNLYMIDPFLTTTDDIARLPPFDPIRKHQYAEMVFDTLRLFREETEGRIPINIHMPQGPLETFGCMCDSSCFYLAMIDDPNLIIGALEKVLDAYIWYIRRQMEILGPETVQLNFAMSYCHRPTGTGIGVGEDVIATIGPDCFKLTLPLYERIARKFGPLLIHSCGNPRQQLPLIMETEAIHAIHFSQLNAEDFMPKITRSIVLQSRNDWKSFEQLEQYAKVAKQCGMRIAYQFQSLAEFMQVGADRSQYDPTKMNELFVRAQAIIDGIYRQ